MTAKRGVQQRHKRPKLAADGPTLERLEALGRVQCSLAEVAPLFDVTAKTLQLFVKETKAARLAYERGKVAGVVALREAQFKLAETSVPMATLLGKIFLGQDDRRDSDDNAPFDRAAAAERIRAKIASVILEAGPETTGGSASDA